MKLAPDVRRPGSRNPRGMLTRQGLAQIIEDGEVVADDLSTLTQAVLSRKQWGVFVALTFSVLLLFFVSLSWSSVHIPLHQIWAILLGGAVERESWRTILIDIRLPRTITAMLVGVGLGLSGLQMQTLFRNPLASPFTLGVSAGAGLGVAVVVIVLPVTFGYGTFGGGLWDNLSTVSGAALGAFFVLALMLAIAVRVRDMTTVLLFGVVIGSLVSAVVTVLVFFADEQRTREFVEWGFGSFHKVRWSEVPFFFAVIGVGTTMTLVATKSLNVLLLGENYARSMGLNIPRARLGIMTSAAIMSGAIVAYAGPIGFLGIAIPHLARGLLGTSNHRVLVPASLFIGMAIALACGLLAELPGHTLFLPINAATSLFGAPVALWVLSRARRGEWV